MLQNWTVAINVSNFLWWKNDKIFRSNFNHGWRGLAIPISTSKRSQYINCLFPAFSQQNDLHISIKNLYLRELSNVNCTRSVIPARSAIMFLRLRTIYGVSPLWKKIIFSLNALEERPQDLKLFQKLF